MIDVTDFRQQRFAIDPENPQHNDLVLSPYRDRTILLLTIPRAFRNDVYTMRVSVQALLVIFILDKLQITLKKEKSHLFSFGAVPNKGLAKRMQRIQVRQKISKQVTIIQYDCFTDSLSLWYILLYHSIPSVALALTLDYQLLFITCYQFLHSRGPPG